MHVLFVETPAVTENLQVSQSVHVQAAEAPMCMRYLPLTHSMQMLAEEAPSVTEYLPVMQLVHTAKPMSILYFPFSHEVHVLLFPPVNPELH